MKDVNGLRLRYATENDYGEMPFTSNNQQWMLTKYNPNAMMGATAKHSLYSTDTTMHSKIPDIYRSQDRYLEKMKHLYNEANRAYKDLQGSTHVEADHFQELKSKFVNGEIQMSFK